MSKNIVDIRAKVSQEDGIFLQTVALACGKDAASIVRDLVHDFLVQKRREYTIAARFARGEGFEGSSRGIDE